MLDGKGDPVHRRVDHEQQHLSSLRDFVRIESLKSRMVIQAFPWLRYATESLLLSAPSGHAGFHPSKSSEVSPSLSSRKPLARG